jgi:uncharacterized FAD-dependent dehydrogenase
MRYRINGLRLRYDRDSAEALADRAAQQLGIRRDDLTDLRVARRSIDARKEPAMIVYSVDVDSAVPLSGPDAQPVPEPPVLDVVIGTESASGTPIVVGAGPAGLFCAWILARHGYRPLVLERGGDVASRNLALAEFARTRVVNEECNALFGLGGAGTFSDGKLTTSLSHPFIRCILDVLVECGAPGQILTDARPHIGTDRLQLVVTRLAACIEALGGRIFTGVRMTGLRTANGAVVGVQTTDGPMDSGTVVMATGHSARDTWCALQAAGVALAPKPFQMGVRVEHPQEWLDRQQFGAGAGHPALGAADYKLATRVDGVPVFSFCMCPGGWTMASVNESGHLCVNGMSLHARNGRFSSSGLVVTLEPDDFGGTDLSSCLSFVRGVEAACFVRGGSDYTAPAQTLPSFLKGRVDRTLPGSGYAFGLRAVDLKTVLPPFVADRLRRAIPAFHRQLPGFLQDRAVAIAPEARASSPVRIVRDKETRQSISCRGLYPAGEGAGYAGGIVSAALDGLHAGLQIIERFAPPSC